MSEKLIFENLRILAVAKGAKVTRERLEIYTKILTGYEYEKVIFAINKILITSKFFPDLSEIVDIVNPKPKEQDGDIAVNKIFKAIRFYGYLNAEGAEKTLGPEIWRVVTAMGGWKIICDTPEFQVGTLRAQIKKMAIAVKMKNYETNLRISQETRLKIKNPLKVLK